MAYVKGKTVGGNTYYNLVETYRDSGKVKTRTLAYLGTHATVEAAYQFWIREAKRRTPHPGATEEQVEAFYASFRGSWERHKLRAKEMVEKLEQYRPPRIPEAHFTVEGVLPPTADPLDNLDT